MSETDVDRNRVFRTTRVRTSLKDDVSWIQKSAQENDEEDSARTEQPAVETRPGLRRLNSYVLSTAKKFESLSSPQSPSHLSPSKGPQAPTEELIQSGEQPEKSLANTTAGNKEENADQSNVELNGGTTEVSADLHVNEHIFKQPVSSTKEVVKPAEHPVTNTTAENKGEYADTADDQSNVEQSEVKVSADAHVESPAAETSAAAGTEESNNTAEIPLKPQEEPASETEAANATKLADAGVEPTVQHAEGTCKKCPPEQAAEEIVLLKAVVVVVVESSPDKSDVINATPQKEAAVQQIVEPVPDLVADSVSELPPQPAAEVAMDENHDEGPPEQTVVETVEVVTEVNVASIPEAPAVIDAAGEEAVVQACLEPVPDLVAESVSELPLESAAEAATEGHQDDGPPEQTAEEIVVAVMAVVAESSPDESDVINATPEEEAAVQQIVESIPDLVTGSVSESAPQPAAEAATDRCQDEGPPEQAAEEIVEVVTEVNVASLPETLAVTDAGEEAVVQACLEPVPDLVAESVSELPLEPAAEAATELCQDKGRPEQTAEEIIDAVMVVVVESSPDESDVINATPEEEAVVQQIVESIPYPATGSVSESAPQPAAEAATDRCQDEGPPEQAAEEIVEAVTEVNVVSLPETLAVIDAVEEAVVQQIVEPVPDLVADSVSELPPQPPAEAAMDENHDEGPPEQAVVEIVEAVTDVIVASVPEAPAVIDAAGEEAVVQACLEPVPDLVVESVSELLLEPAAEAATEGHQDEGPPEQTAEEIVEAVTEVNVVSLPETLAVTDAVEEAVVQQSVEQVHDLVVESVSELPPQPAAEAPLEESHDKDPPEQAVVETVETVTEVNVASLPEAPAPIEAAGEEAVVQQSVEQVPDLVVETAAMSVASTKTVLQTKAEEVVECEVQPTNNTVVEQSIKPIPENAAGHKVELCIEDAVEPTTAPEAEAAQEFTYRAIELTEALDVEPPAPEATDEPLKSPEQSHTKEMTPAISDMLQKPKEELPSRQILYETRGSINVCSVCDKKIGNIKIIFSEPPVICHPECLKCRVCDKALGDMLTPMFLHNQVIQCEGCFAKTLKT